jgi:hypothetical protein
MDSSTPPQPSVLSYYNLERGLYIGKFSEKATTFLVYGYRHYQGAVAQQEPTPIRDLSSSTIPDLGAILYQEINALGKDPFKVPLHRTPLSLAQGKIPPVHPITNEDIAQLVRGMESRAQSNTSYRRRA